MVEDRALNFALILKARPRFGPSVLEMFRSLIERQSFSSFLNRRDVTLIVSTSAEEDRRLLACEWRASRLSKIFGLGVVDGA